MTLGLSEKTPQVVVRLEEYRELNAEMRARIDLQHRNMNVFLVVLVAITGYLVKYASEHGLGVQHEGLIGSEFAMLIVLVPFIGNVFLWRHLDHDVNIIDKASYIQKVLQPALTRDLDGESVLGFEGFLHHQRGNRTFRLGPLLNLGKEDVPMFLLIAVYLAAAWNIRLGMSGYAGGARDLFDWFLYVGSVLTAVSIAMSIAVGLEYRAVGETGSDEGPTPSDARPDPRVAVDGDQPATIDRDSSDERQVGES